MSVYTDDDDDDDDNNNNCNGKENAVLHWKNYGRTSPHVKRSPHSAAGFTNEVRNISRSPAVTLTGVVQLVKHCPAKQKVVGLILGQGTCLGCRFNP